MVHRNGYHYQRINPNPDKDYEHEDYSSQGLLRRYMTMVQLQILMTRCKPCDELCIGLVMRPSRASPRSAATSDSSGIESGKSSNFLTRFHSWGSFCVTQKIPLPVVHIKDPLYGTQMYPSLWYPQNILIL